MEHFRGGFRVDSDIEFRIRREVAAARRAAHDHQPANAQVALDIDVEGFQRWAAEVIALAP